MKMLDKHKSKLHKGFEKQRLRQDLKPDKVKVEVKPTILTYSFKHSKYVPIKQKHRNNKWNGMNLKCLCSYFIISRVGGMYGKFAINSDGKYILSRHGKQLLNKKRLWKQTTI